MAAAIGSADLIVKSYTSPSYPDLAASCAISFSFSVLKDFGLSMGRPSALSHTREERTPSARDTPNSTV